MKINFTEHELPVDALCLSDWECIEEKDVSFRNSIVPFIIRHYEIRPNKVEYRFAPEFEIAMETDSVVAEVWPDNHLNSIEVRCQECSSAEVFQLATPIIENWHLTCSELIAQGDGENPLVRYSDAQAELIAWLENPESPVGLPSYIADSVTRTSPGISFFRLIIVQSENDKAMFSLRLISHWRQRNFET